MIACVLIDDFAVIAHPAAPRHAPLVFFNDSKRRAGVAAVSARGAAFGIARGMSRSRIQALCPTATIMSLEQSSVDALLKRVLNTLWTYTNRIEVDEAGLPQTALLHLDLGRTTGKDALMLGRHMLRTLGRLDIAARIGLAHGKFAAHAAALSSGPSDVRLIARGTEAEHLAPMPAGLLPLTKDARRIVSMMRIRTIGEFAALPRSAVVTQFGRHGQLWHQLANGADYRAVRPQRMPETETVGRDFDDPVGDLARIQWTLDRIAETLAARLESRASVSHEFTLTVSFGAESRAETQLRADGIAGSAAIRTQLSDLLDRLQPDRAVTGITVEAGYLQAHIPRQLELFSYKPARQAMIDLVQVLIRRHGSVFYTVQRGDRSSLLPEEQYRLTQIDTKEVS
jgi:nucleotidyltransferase/DNA polymerase involved in DNA repair